MTIVRYLLLFTIFVVSLIPPSSSLGETTNSTTSTDTTNKSNGSITGSISNAAGTVADAVSGVFGSIKSAAGLADDKDEAKPAGLHQSRKTINALVKEIYDDPSIQRYLGSSPPTAQKALQKYDGNWEDCRDKQATAATWCLETNNTDIQTALSSINMIASSAGLSSVYDSCTTMGKVVNIGTAALTAYSAQCGVWRSACALSCVASRNGATELKAVVESTKCTLVDNNLDGLAKCNEKLAEKRPELLEKITKELNLDKNTSIATKTEKCTTKYLALLGSAALGLANLSKAMKGSDECKKESDGSTVASLAEKCADSANAALPECICIANPRTAGCASGLSSVGELNAGGPSAVGANALSSADKDVGDLNLGSDNGFKMAEQSASSDGGGVGAPVGGGGSGLGGLGGGGGGGPGGDKGAAGGRLNTNILEGTGGGGGGAGSGYGGYGEDRNGYRKYLPGGANDPARGLAGQGNALKEVTGQGGKSNFEKVRDRYIDNKRSLLSN